MFKFKFSYVMLAAALSSSFVYADPTTYTHSSGTKVIDIEKPNAAGVSHNMYRDFNVDSKGLILNNSANDLNHDSLGNIAKNNNLTDGNASVILNEVISNKSSALNGFIEVAGQKADVIIANPNGISCSGCSFINTNKAVLTTGKVNLNDSGEISSYTVTGGELTIGQNGMDATNSYAVLLADAIAINGTINAKNAIVGGGNFTFDNSTGAMTSAGKSATVMQTLFPEYSVDISNLGGIKANSISMIGNNLGFGVRNKGAIVANSSLAMTSNGLLTNEGSITSNGMITQIASAGNLKNTGNISTKNMTLLNSLSSLTNEGAISSTKQLLVSASGNIENAGTIKSETTLNVTTAGNLKTTYGSNLLSDNQLVVTALGNIDNGGSTRGKNTMMTFGGNSLKVTGNIYGYDTLLVQAMKSNEMTSGEITNSGTMSGKNVTIQTKGTLAINAGHLLASESLTTNSYWLNNAKGNIRGNDATINLNNTVTNNTGHIIGDTLNITTKLDLLNEGLIQSMGDLNINTQGRGNIINRSVISAAGTMTLDATRVINGGYSCGWFYLNTCGKGTLRANKLILNSTHQYANNMGGNQYFKVTEVNTK
ncbi:filamentous hemagglutinin N-terminal domain-containing protein [Klebsiella sp. RHBSTW-00484]|uniref:filamentous hemagglutinin N-terminal domain-containing protein n=1 Tax=unclassified Klebsiella TaxID=2608929 RepID=UPI0015E57EBA|nr:MULTISPECIES: filamentous hemagglutinin N-terminal domain-containing protein [unclassified Klebsiella]MBA7846108.1 filamentous hemagglutinin N-terminal domain-containing protein [Klebsiella sp. RHBSTW-00465]QLO37970.1 filamentous hemagglutinin N-terminal domain-containing protein [Klebsiella sp. RHBSTW-00484]QLT77490.1 filamentous hemagglutinin N-terminal domain-containing protein [Klebsiella sp. RHBSTW-00464]